MRRQYLASIHTPHFNQLGIRLYPCNPRRGRILVRGASPNPEIDGFAHRIMLAVLPFRNLSGHASRTICEGFIEELIAHLRRLPPKKFGELRHRTYQKEVTVAQKTTAVDIPVSKVHVGVLRKLDRPETRMNPSHRRGARIGCLLYEFGFSRDKKGVELILAVRQVGTPGLVMSSGSIESIDTVWEVSGADPGRGEVCETFSFAKPKSKIFACPRAVMKMFAGLMSRWMIPFWWAESRASVI